MTCSSSGRSRKCAAGSGADGRRGAPTHVGGADPSPGHGRPAEHAQLGPDPATWRSPRPRDRPRSTRRFPLPTAIVRPCQRTIRAGGSLRAIGFIRERCRSSLRSKPGSPFQLPPIEILEPATSFPIQEHEAKVNARAMLLERTLLDFGYQVRVVQIDTGPVITQFEIELEAGLRVSKIMSLADDLAIALAVPSVRIVAPIPGKTTVGIEVPNDHRNVVRLGEVMAGVAGRSQGMPHPACSSARTSRASRWSSTWPRCRTC